MRGAEAPPDGRARHAENEKAHPDEDVHQPDAHRADGDAREEDSPDEVDASSLSVPLDHARQRHQEQDQAEERDREEDPHHVPPCPRHHGRIELLEDDFSGWTNPLREKSVYFSRGPEVQAVSGNISFELSLLPF